MKKKLIFLLLTLIIMNSRVSAELDLREANVTAVEFQDRGDSFNFDVTLYHDDDGEEGYADHWQVESLNGSLLGRRVLTHPHGTVEFTRSEIIPISTEEWVVIRGHDSTHGYGGQLALVNLMTSEKLFVDQGSEPRNMSNYFDDTNVTLSYTDVPSTSDSLPLLFMTPLSFIVLVVISYRKKSSKAEMSHQG